MDLQFHGANCVSLTYKNTRLVIDDNLAELGKKSATKDSDVNLFTFENFPKTEARLKFNGAGEYEIGDMSVIGIDTTPFMNDDSGKKTTMFRITAGDVSVLVTGHVLGEFNQDELEKVGNIDVLVVPVGNNAYTLDAVGALKLIKDFEPKIVVPTHFKSSKITYPIDQVELDAAVKDLAMDVKDKVTKLKIKPAELNEVTQLVVLEEV